MGSDLKQDFWQRQLHGVNGVDFSKPYASHKAKCYTATSWPRQYTATKYDKRHKR
jgi:predicted phosphoadenosine phosphosulfate sulfurtransferase